jgi:hypothetical protein
VAAGGAVGVGVAVDDEQAAATKTAAARTLTRRLRIYAPPKKECSPTISARDVLPSRE